MAMPPKKRTQLLDIVRSEPGLSVATLAERVDCGVSYAYRMVDWLEEHGDVVREKGDSRSNVGGVFPATDGVIWDASRSVSVGVGHVDRDQRDAVDRLRAVAEGSSPRVVDSRAVGGSVIALGEAWQVVATRLGDHGETIVTLRTPNGAEIEVAGMEGTR